MNTPGNPLQHLPEGLVIVTDRHGRVRFRGGQDPDSLEALAADPGQARLLELAWLQSALCVRICCPDGLDGVQEMAVYQTQWEGEGVYLVNVQAEQQSRGAAPALLAVHCDPLTGLAGRDSFLEQLEVAFERQQEEPSSSLAVLCLDLERFRQVNEALGFEAGDMLLAEVGQRLLRCVRNGDRVARLGADEFAILLEGIEGQTTALAVAARIEAAFNVPSIINTREIFASVKIGIAMAQRGHTAAQELLREADIAKHSTPLGGRTVLFQHGMQQSVLAELCHESALRRAVERNEFELRYQPVVCLRTGSIEGFEALVRWRDPVRGIISPVDFIPLAEQTGLIIPIGEWVLAEACRQMRLWHRLLGPEQRPRLSVNLSARQFWLPRAVDRILCIVAATGFDPRYLSLEVTESVFIDRVVQAQGVLSELQNAEIKLHLDDFGTGYSSLSYLQQFPVDTLKIDRSFVQRVASDPRQSDLVRTIVTLARNFGMGITAEGIEQREQLEVIQEFRCDQAQGYFFARPLTTVQTSHLIASYPRWHDVIDTRPTDRVAGSPAPHRHLFRG